APQAGAYQPVQASVDGRAQRPSRSDGSKRDEVPNLLLPPRAKVLQAVKSEARVSEAALVDDQARREPARGDSGHDLVVAQDLRLQVIAPQGEEQLRRRRSAGPRAPLPRQVDVRLPCDDERTRSEEHTSELQSRENLVC